MPVALDDVGECVEAALRRIGPRVVLALPLGIGKPNPIVNEFYRRAVRDPSIDLTILTALSLRKPTASGDLERRLVEPMTSRIFGDYPELEYVHAMRRDGLPANVRVTEFYLEPGAYLASRQAQRNYLSANYTHVARDVLARGVNVIAHVVAKRTAGGTTQISLGSNPDVTVDLLPAIDAAKQAGREILLIGLVHAEMPFMFDAAAVPAERFDYLVEHERYHYRLFCPPNLPLGSVDYAIGLHASALVRDGGTLQIGIGELGDALVYALLLRHQQNAAYRRALQLVDAERAAPLIEAAGGRGTFVQGLFASSEMFVDQMLDLFRSGILTRRVYDSLEAERAAAAGEPVAGGHVLHAGFLLGPRGFYAALREMPESDRRLFAMRGVGYINQLYGDDYELRVLQRRHARFINTTMMVSLLGAATSDGLADGRVVSGVGGQYDFVAMGHALPDARSILCVRATRTRGGRTTSNIVWSAGHVTIPRHLRDIVITEYGAADLRGRTDQEIVAALLDIADSRFQDSLLAEAKAAGKIAPDYRIPDARRANLPERLEGALASERRAGRFSDYPFGTDLTAEEISLAKALRHLAARRDERGGRLKLGLAALLKGGDGDVRRAPLLRRLGLDRATTVRERLLRRLVCLALHETGN